VNHLQPISRFRVSALSAGLFIACAGLILGPAHPTQAALVDGAKGRSSSSDSTMTGSTTRRFKPALWRTSPSTAPTCSRAALAMT
jgi:hypothetical protein